MREVLLVSAYVLAGSASVVVFAALCALLARIRGMRCPRCSGRVAWLRSNERRNTSGWCHTVFCFRCRAITRVVRFGDGWTELGPDD